MPNFIPAYAFSNVVGGVTKGKATLEKVILSEKIKEYRGCRLQRLREPENLPDPQEDSS